LQNSNAEPEYPALNEDLDLLIQQKERQLSPLRGRMEEIRQQFIQELTNFATKWYQDTAKQYVIKYSEITFSLKKEKLAEMKTRVSTLVKDSDRIVKKVLSNPQIWWHLEPHLHDTVTQYDQLGNDSVGNKFPEKIDNPIRQVLGELGDILEQYGYRVTTNPNMKASYPEFWFYTPEGSKKETQPYYPHLIEWSEQMQNTIYSYNTLFQKAIQLYIQIQKLKDEKKQRQASQLWDST
jgi:hypothetical protein